MTTDCNLQPARTAARLHGVTYWSVYKLCQRVPGLGEQTPGGCGSARWRWMVRMDRLAELLTDETLRHPLGRPRGRPRHRPPAERPAPAGGGYAGG